MGSAQTAAHRNPETMRIKRLKHTQHTAEAVARWCSHRRFPCVCSECRKPIWAQCARIWHTHSVSFRIPPLILLFLRVVLPPAFRISLLLSVVRQQAAHWAICRSILLFTFMFVCALNLLLFFTWSAWFFLLLFGVCVCVQFLASRNSFSFFFSCSTFSV